jgi:hypothetical protein
MRECDDVKKTGTAFQEWYNKSYAKEYAQENGDPLIHWMKEFCWEAWQAGRLWYD